jgi:MFS transporter, FSR family, fosmidomycin resistance protein
MPVGLAADSPRRARLVLGGGALFTAALIAVALAPAFGWLLLAFAVLYPASGAFVALSQADLMDAAPARREQNMARWTLAGSIGGLAGPAVLALAIFAGAGWRAAYIGCAVVAAAVLLSRVLAPSPAHAEAQAHTPFRAALLAALRALRRGDVLGALALLEISDLMLDVLTGYLALYFVDVLHQPAWFGAVVVAVRIASNLAGDLVSVAVLERISGTPYVRDTAIGAAIAYAAVLLVPNVYAKLAIVALLSLLTAGWYPVLQARVYHALPGQSGALLAIGNVFNLVMSPVALLIGIAATRFGLSATLWFLIFSPLAIAMFLRRRPQETA